MESWVKKPFGALSSEFAQFTSDCCCVKAVGIVVVTQHSGHLLSLCQLMLEMLSIGEILEHFCYSI